MRGEICPPENCTGCGACHQACPTHCIIMSQNSIGFSYPEIDEARCTNCDVCREVCAALHCDNPEGFTEPHIYACWHRDDQIRQESSSGGVFAALSQFTLEQQGLVLGAAYTEQMEVRHVIIDSMGELPRLQGSKYVQSDIGNSYQAVKTSLQAGKRVLFSGTPCQVHALKRYLGAGDENLLTCDLICHGVPSPGMFAAYIHWLEAKYKCKILRINFRNKKIGWVTGASDPSTASFEDGREIDLLWHDDSFKYFFHRSLCLRPICYRCVYNSIYRQSDITLADFWAIGELVPFNHDKRLGISLIMINTPKGESFFHGCSKFLYFEKRSLDEALQGQRKLRKPTSANPDRKQFESDYVNLSYEQLSRKYCRLWICRTMIKQYTPSIVIDALRVFRRFCRSARQIPAQWGFSRKA